MKRMVVSLIAIAICMVASQDARAARRATRTAHTGADFGLKCVGGEVGFVSPENINGTFQFGAFASLETIAPGVAMSSHVDYWSHSEGMSGVDASIRDITIGLMSVYMFPVTSPKVKPYAGGGLGMHFLNAKVEVPSLPTVE